MGSDRRGCCSVSVVTVLLMVAASSGAYCLGSSDREINSPHGGLQLDGPEEIFRSDGGSMEIWSSNNSVLQTVGVTVTRVTLQPRGLALPKYCNGGQLAYVLQGTANVGLAYPPEQSVHVLSVKKGNVIAIPQGVAHWLYNGGNEPFVVLGIADTGSEMIPGEHHIFFMAGAETKEWGSGVLQAFDDELLSHAWDVDTDIVKRIKFSQKGTVIVNVHRDIQTPFILQARGVEASTSIWENYVYNIDEAKPDIKVNNGGSLSMLTSKKFPILEEMLLTAVRLRLDSGALFGPAFTSNVNLLVYVTGGSGRVQIVGSENQLLDAEVTKGSVLMIPQFHPAIVTSGVYGLEVVAMGTSSDSPLFSFLAGKNALDMSIPIEVLAASSNVSVEVQQTILDHRQAHAEIFPPRGKSSSDKNNARFVRNGLNSVLLLLSILLSTRF